MFFLLKKAYLEQSAQTTVCSSVKWSLRGLGWGLRRVSPPLWWGHPSGVTCHPPALVACAAHLVLRDAVGTWGRREGATRPPGPGGIAGMWDVQKEGEEPWETAETEARRAGFGEGRRLVQEVGRKGDAEGSRGQGQEMHVGHWTMVQQHRGVGGEMVEGREVGWCELVWFSTN